MSTLQALFFAIVLTLCVAPAGAETVVLDPARIDVPRWEGWGTSLCWWAVFTDKWDEARRKEACRLLFSRDPDALGLTIARYNAGGTSPDADRKPFRPGAAVLVTLDRDGSWHPERDAGQMACLKLAKRFGANTFEIFSNSPPHWMLRNGNTRGGDNGAENIDRTKVGDFAKWLVDVTRRTEQACGLKFASIEPFNEPTAWWWNPKSNGQEGCKFTWGAQGETLKALRIELDKQKAPPIIACSDENGAGQAYNTLDWLTKPDEGNWSGGGLDARTIERLNVHSYTEIDSQERLRDLAKAKGIPALWMSELSCREWENAGYIPNDMRCALPLTRGIVGDIRRLKCSAWVLWQPIEPLQFSLWYHYTYGLMQAATDADVEWNGRTYRPGEWVVSKGFHAVRQFTAFIRPGDRILSCPDRWAIAALSADGKRATIVVHNELADAKPYSFDLSAFGKTGKQAKVWRTSDAPTENCSPLANLPIAAAHFADTVPPRSVTTYVVSIGKR